ncbi:hypothetical protein [Stratiformator vulcanicus]|uniref:Uncharacterized protein n=1 Tax=Stratiformator vulcanicus TaxID=2527980 RepID=A0A517R6A3_9PLAN|nr:hypothetical protein [Stratiformator vulcanicus]QDT39427.1 hypothetical protein Pan189_38340 [Stratiformator vulcanicus]
MPKTTPENAIHFPTNGSSASNVRHEREAFSGILSEIDASTAGNGMFRAGHPYPEGGTTAIVK